MWVYGLAALVWIALMVDGVMKLRNDCMNFEPRDEIRKKGK